MYKLTLLLIPLILLSSCTIDWNDEKDTKITELEKQNIELKAKNDDELFKKNKECYTYKDKIGKYLNFENLESIFYSPIRKTCISVIKYNTKDDFMGYFVRVSDVLTNNDLFSDLNKSFDHAISFNEEIKYLKGEDYIKSTPELENLKISIINETKTYMGNYFKSKLGENPTKENIDKIMDLKDYEEDEEFWDGLEKIHEKTKAIGGLYEKTILRELYNK